MSNGLGQVIPACSFKIKVKIKKWRLMGHDLIEMAIAAHVRVSESEEWRWAGFLLALILPVS
jgi:hypothetical protein